MANILKPWRPRGLPSGVIVGCFEALATPYQSVNLWWRPG